VVLAFAAGSLAGQSAPTALTPPTAAKPAAASGASAEKAGPDHRRANKAIVRRYLVDVLSNGKLDLLEQLLAKDFVDRTPDAPTDRGPGAVRAAQKKIRDVFAKVDYHVLELVAEDERVVARYMVEATPRLRDPKQATRAIVINGVTEFRFANGKIAEMWIMNDQLNMLRQLGFVVSPPPGATPPPPAKSP
jgi:predicted ester cyclase